MFLKSALVICVKEEEKSRSKSRFTGKSREKRTRVTVRVLESGKKNPCFFLMLDFCNLVLSISNCNLFISIADCQQDKSLVSEICSASKHIMISRKNAQLIP